MQKFFAFSGLINTVISLFLGVLVLVRNRREKLNILCALLAFSTTLWSFFYWRWLLVTDNSQRALFLVRWLSVFSTFIPLFYFHWVTEVIKEKRPKVLAFYYSLTLFYSFFFFSNFFVASVVPISHFLFWPQPGPIYNMYFLTHYLILVPYGLYLLTSKYRLSKGTEELQYKYVLIGSIVGLGGAFTNFFLWYGINIPPIGNFLVPFYVISFTYAIVKYRLLGIRFIFNKLYYYGVISIFSFTFFYLNHFVTTYLGGIYSFESVGVGLAFSVVFSLILLPLIEYIQFTGDNIFFHGRNPNKVIKDLLIRLNESIDMDHLFDTLVAEFKRIIDVDDVRVLVFSGGSNDEDDIKKSYFDKNNFNIGDEIKKIDRLVVFNEVERTNRILASEMKKAGIKVIIPLFSRDKKIGFIFLGDKISRDAYAKEDIDFLEIVGSQAAIAIENAHLYKEVEDFNNNLKIKVENQIGEIKEKTESLRKLLIMRSEFLDVSSHQLRTPISVIKGMLSMLSIDSISEDKKKEFVDACLQKSIKLEEIISDILYASEMDSSRFELNLKSLSVLDIIKEVKEELDSRAKEKKIKLILHKPEADLPLVMSDKNYLKYALRNIIKNAIQYTLKGKVDIGIENDNKNIIINVADTGIGIPEKDVERIFNKFSRAKNAIDAYADGSGLGLFIARKIIEAHPGAKAYIKKTEVNKGTIVVVKIPFVRRGK